MNKSILLPILTALLFSGSFIAGKFIAFSVDPLAATFFRYITAIVFLTCLGLFRGRQSFAIKPKDAYKFLILGLTGVIGYHYFFFTALKYTAATNTAIINAFSPAITSLGAAIFVNERFRPKNYAGIIIAFLGVVVLLTGGSWENIKAMNFNIGDLLMLCSVVSWVIYALVVKTLSGRYQGFTITFYGSVAGVLLLPLLLFGGNFFANVANISMQAVLSILYMGIFASGLAYLLYIISIKRIGATRSSGFVYSLVPVFTAILSFLILGEEISYVILVSLGLIIGGLFLLMKK